MNETLSAIGLGGGITGGYWDQADAATLASAGLSNTGAAPAAASAGTSSFWSSLGSNLSGLLSFAQQAAPVAQAGLNLANSASNKAANTTASASGTFTSSTSGMSPIIWLGAIGGGLLLLWALLKH